MIGTDGERESGKPVPLAQFVDDDDEYMVSMYFLRRTKFPLCIQSLIVKQFRIFLCLMAFQPLWVA